MQLKFLGNGGSGGGGCPALLATDTGAYIVQGWETSDSAVIEIPHLLLGFAEPDTFVGSTMTDTGRGTFTLTGRPVIDRATLDQLDLAPGETAIEVPKCERKFYGAPAGR